MCVVSSDYTDLVKYCLENGSQMLRSAEGLLKYSYIDPSGPYSKNLWDWDSFWAATALLGLAKKYNLPDLKDKTLIHLKGSVDNFFDHQGDDGSIPILMTPDNTDSFSSVNNPKENMAKPVIGQMCSLLLSYNVLTTEDINLYTQKLSLFHKCYKNRYQHLDTKLYVWATDAAIGVDDDPATWGRPPFSSASIFLNCLLYMDLQAGIKLAAAGNNEAELEFKFLENELREAINSYCQDKNDGLYYSVDVLCKQNLRKWNSVQLNENLTPFWHCIPIKIASWVSFMPLWCGLADQSFAERMIKTHLLKEERFWTNYGVRSLAADERMYSPDVARGNPSNWLGPIWIIANYVVWQGLKRYGFDAEAECLGHNNLSLLSKDYKNHSSLHEYYNPETGEGVTGKGFLNWNLLACLMHESF